MLRRAFRTLVVLLGALILTSCAVTPEPTADVRAQLAPSGSLRAAINLGNSVLAQKDSVTGALQGVSVDLARELGRRLDVPVEFVIFDAAGKVFAALKTGGWDVAFLAVDPERAQGIDFSASYVVIEGTYLVAADSPLRSIGEVDRPGIRVAVGNKSAYDLYLTRTMKQAQLVRVPTSPEALEVFAKERLEVAAGVKQLLVEFARTHPGLRVMDGHFMTIEQAVATPKGRAQGARYLRRFVEEMKASGFVAAALSRSGQRDAAVAPAAGFEQ